GGVASVAPGRDDAYVEGRCTIGGVVHAQAGTGIPRRAGAARVRTAAMPPIGILIQKQCAAGAARDCIAQGDRCALAACRPRVARAARAAPRRACHSYLSARRYAKGACGGAAAVAARIAHASPVTAGTAGSAAGNVAPVVAGSVAADGRGSRSAQTAIANGIHIAPTSALGRTTGV